MGEGLQPAADEAAATVTGEAGQQPVPGDEASTALEGVARAKGLHVEPEDWFRVPALLGGTIRQVGGHFTPDTTMPPNHMTPGHYAGRSAHFH